MINKYPLTLDEKVAVIKKRLAKMSRAEKIEIVRKSFGMWEDYPKDWLDMEESIMNDTDIIRIEELLRRILQELELIKKLLELSIDEGIQLKAQLAAQAELLKRALDVVEVLGSHEGIYYYDVLKTTKEKAQALLPDLRRAVEGK